MKQRFALSLLVVAVSASADSLVSIADLACPCQVTSIDMDADGGTLGGALEDVSGNVLESCLDSRATPISFTADGEPIPPQPR